MALINCSECGNQVNENDRVCQNCGNPLIQNNYYNEKEEIKVKGIIDDKEIRKNGIIVLILITVISFLLGNFLGNNFTYRTIEYNSFAEGYIRVSHFGVIGYIVWTIGAVLAIIMILTIICYRRQKLFIKDGKICGNVKTIFFEMAEINIPLNQVNYVSILKPPFILFPIKLCISSSSGKYTIGYLKNYEEVRSVILDEIEKNKN